MEKERITIEEPVKRIDAYLAHRFDEYSRGYFQRQIQQGRVLVNTKPVTPHQPLKVGDVVEMTFEELARPLIGEDVPVSVVYEDDDILIINKSVGMVVHPACGHWSGTLLNALVGRSQQHYTPLLVHRLDKDTSGVMIVAKNERAKHSLVAQFQKRVIKKVYYAIVCGVIHERRGRIDAPLGRSAQDRKKIEVGPLARKPAITEFKVVGRGPGVTLVEAYPLTGRTHQIRSHFAFIGHPVAGDVVYGGAIEIEGQVFTRHMLHAGSITFTHPAKSKTVTFTVPLPPDMVPYWKPES